MQTVRLGVAGAGYWGPNLVRNCYELGILDSVCDKNPRVLESVKATYPGIATTVDYHEMLGRPIDGVIIATPAQLHAEMALEAIAWRKHVFVEKPLALNLADGKKVVDAAASAGVQIFVGHVLLYHPAVRKMLSLIAEDVIGSVWHVRSRRLSLGKLRNHESVWWSFAPHDVALMLSIMKATPRTVRASHGVAFIPGLSDIAYADFGFPEDRTAHIEVCWLDPEKSSRVDVFGTTGVLTLKDSRAGSSLSLARFKIVSDGSGARKINKETTEEIAIEAAEPLRAEIVAFVEAIRTGRISETSGEAGLAVLRTLSMAAVAFDQSHYVDAVV